MLKLLKVQSFVIPPPHIWQTEPSSGKLMVDSKNNNENLKCCFAALLLWPGILLLVIILYDTPDLHVYLPTDKNKQMNRCQSRFQTAFQLLERGGGCNLSSDETEWMLP